MLVLLTENVGDKIILLKVVSVPGMSVTDTEVPDEVLFWVSVEVIVSVLAVTL
jgi:hypothetical protein